MSPDRRHPTPNALLWSGDSRQSKPRRLARDTRRVLEGTLAAGGWSPLTAGGALAGPGPAAAPPAIPWGSELERAQDPHSVPGPCLAACIASCWV